MTSLVRAGCLAGVLIVAAVTSAGASIFAKSLTLDDRIAAQRAVEDVLWRNRVWPKDNTRPKPSLDAVMPRAALEARVADSLKKSRALESRWHRPITGAQLQAELDRMARDTRDPKVLGELFDALGNDPDLIAETLVRPILADRLVRSWQAGEARAETFDAWWREHATSFSADVPAVAHGLTLPGLPSSSCAIDTWSLTRSEVPDSRVYHLAVWTGSEMIVWGGGNNSDALQTGGRYDPATDTWTPTSVGPATPMFLSQSTVVWTGTEMIVWGGLKSGSNTEGSNAGGRYNPTTDTWLPLSSGPGTPSGRFGHTTVWTGSEMIVWGGVEIYVNQTTQLASNVAWRYRPQSDTWIPASVDANTPSRRASHCAVWTGREMIVWGGGGGSGYMNTGARYDPVSDSWTPTSLGSNVPAGRQYALAVWTGSEMIIWGGYTANGNVSTGGRYDPLSDTWRATSAGTGVPSFDFGTTAVWTGSRMIVLRFEGSSYDPVHDSWTAIAASPGVRRDHTAVWTGTEMIVWGGYETSVGVNTGARYDPATDSWVSTSLGSVPSQRSYHQAVWTGSEMIVWGGSSNGRSYPAHVLATGGRYTPATDSWTPTSVVDAPPARLDFAALWTGTEMIVWGGGRSVFGSDAMNSGGRYDPTTDTWTPTSTGPNVPAPWVEPVAVWTGSEMIAFTSHNSPRAGRYDPTTDTWTPTSAVDVPAYCFSLVWTGSEAICWAGGVSDGGRYDPAADRWVNIPMSSDPAGGRSRYVAAWTGSEMLLWGGEAPGSEGSRYDPSTGAWRSMSAGDNVPSPRDYAAALWTGTEFLIWGGSNNSYHAGPLGNGGRYDPLTDNWQPIASALVPVQREGLSSVWTGSQMIVWGGWVASSMGGLYCACPSAVTVYRDADGDGYGDDGSTRTRCDGIAPAGYSLIAGDCNDVDPSIHPGAAESCNGLDDDCNGGVDDGGLAEDTDGDSVHDACDDCPDLADPTQSDFDHDGQGDTCDLDDGEIFIFGGTDKNRIEWQREIGPDSWNVYAGDLALLRSQGLYTQAPGSSDLASTNCGITSEAVDDPIVPSPGAAQFWLVTGVTSGVEGVLGTTGSGAPRPNTNPCP